MNDRKLQQAQLANRWLHRCYYAHLVNSVITVNYLSATKTLVKVAPLFTGVT
ncbi:hypothetical protein GCM10009426_06940 [Rheinheimera tangshanensis]|nr:hypothetical protein GCM10010920_06800 [Rheinheimera tangshanensis]